MPDEIVKSPWELQLEAEVLAEEHARRAAEAVRLKEERAALILATTAAAPHLLHGTELAGPAAPAAPAAAPPPAGPVELSPAEIERREAELLRQFEQQQLLSHNVPAPRARPAAGSAREQRLLDKVDGMIEQRRLEIGRIEQGRGSVGALQGVLAALKRPEWFIPAVALVVIIVWILSLSLGRWAGDLAQQADALPQEAVQQSGVIEDESFQPGTPEPAPAAGAPEGEAAEDEEPRETLFD